LFSTFYTLSADKYFEKNGMGAIIYSNKTQQNT